MSKKSLTIVVNPNVDNAEAIKLLESAFDLTVLQGINKSEDLLRCDVVLFTNGPHVNPQYYTEKMGKFTNIDKTRDDMDKKLYDLCRRYGKLFVGFGRGAELLNVFAGGKLVQHVNGHDSKSHSIQSTEVKSSLTVTSAHTQMMYPYELPKEKYQVIAWSRRFLSTTYLNGNNEEMDLVDDFLEPEVIWFKSTKALAIQGSPEAATASKEFKDYAITLIQNRLN